MLLLIYSLVDFWCLEQSAKNSTLLFDDITDFTYNQNTFRNMGTFTDEYIYDTEDISIALRWILPDAKCEIHLLHCEWKLIVQ